jgi:chorismate synthase
MSFRNTFGHVFQVHTFGESHGLALGVVIDGCPSNVNIDEQKIINYMSRRRPGQNEFVTARNESDSYKILSGVFESKTLGTPIAAEVYNENQNSKDYENLKPRKGHADSSWVQKFEHSDLRGGGRSSGRETLSRVLAGSIARQALETLNPDLKIYVWVDSVGPIKNKLALEKFEMKFQIYEGLQCLLGFPDESQTEDLKQLLAEAKLNGESYGGVVRVKIKNLKPGLGQPVFSKLKADLASALFSIGAVQGLNLGAADVHLKGTEFHAQNAPYGGIQGGISTGEDIDLEIKMKPTSSIMDVAKRGRHDPCILPRALVVIESMLALVLVDHLLLSRLDRI